MSRRIVLASCAIVALFASATSTAAPLSVRAQPGRLVLGPGARAAIEIEGVAGDAPPSVTVNVGRVEGLRRVGDARFVAEYLPPPGGYPQVAIVSTSAGDAWAWSSLPLHGRGLAIARSTPRARIRVTIGDATFGPVTADASGEARVPVVAPPGTRFAYHREKPLDLEVPPVLHVHLAIGRSVVRADAAHDVPLRAFVVSPSGAPRAGAPLRVEVSEGAVLNLAEVAPGSWAGTWRLEPGRAGAARGTAALADEPGVTAEVQLRREAGELARLSVHATAQRVATGESVLLRILPTDLAGNPVDAAPSVETTLGALSKPARVAAGAWETSLFVPRHVGTARRVEIAARAGGISGRIELDVATGAPVEMDVSADPAPLVADGGSAARVRVSYRDEFGNPADGPAPEMTADTRATVTAEPDGPGAWMIRYRPPRAWKDREDVLFVRAGGLERATRLGILAPERRLAVAPRVGVAVSANRLLAPTAALEATYRPRWLPRPLALALDVGWVSRDRTDVAQVGDVAIEVVGRARYVPALCNARWEVRAGARQALWAVAGGGGAHVRSEVSSDAAPSVVEQGLVAAFQAGAGWGWRRGHGLPFVEARLAWHGDPHFQALRGSLATLLVAVGYRYDAY